MSVPRRREPRHRVTKWEVIRLALRNWRYTCRLVLIPLALNAPVIALAVRLTTRVPW
jgi:hypothetical protein